MISYHLKQYLESFTIYRIFSVFAVILFGALFLTSCSATRKSIELIDERFDREPAFKTGFSGLVIFDPETNKYLYSRNPHKYFTPASNTKLFTYYTGLQILGDSIPALKYVITDDTLYFKGTGDPSFLNPDLPESKVFDFLEKQDHQLVYVEPGYEDVRFGPGWAWDDYPYYYSAEKSAFPIYGNLVNFRFGENGKLEAVFPEIFRDSIRYSEISEEFPLLKREEFSNNFSISLKKKKTEKQVPIKFSEKTVINLLQDTLKKNINIKDKFPQGLPPKTLYSIKADSLYKQMLQVSDNFIAEQILLMAAEKLTDSLKTTAIIEHMKGNDLKDLPDEPVWRDGSGLSRYNLFTPATLVALLEKIRRTVNNDELLFTILPGGGESGTIKNSYQAAEPYIFAKTGTLSNNHSLSGYLLTRSGKTLIFSFMNSNYTVPTSMIRKEMEAILKTVRDNF